MFFGKATIEGAVVLLLVLFALEASEGAQQLSAFFFAAPAHDDFTPFI